MKRVICAFLGIAMLVNAAHAVSVPARELPTTTPVVFTPEQFQKLTPKQFHQLTGKKLNAVQKLQFKIAQKAIAKAPAGGQKSQLTAVLLCFFLGGLGIHRFYMGYTWQGIVQLLTLGGFGIWSLIDFIRLLTGSLQPKNGGWDKEL